MSNLSLLKKKYNNALSTYQFSKSLLNASVSTQEILNQKLTRVNYIREICCLMNNVKVEDPKIIVLCGPNDMFPGDFKHIIREEGDVLLGRKVKGLEYKLSSLAESLDLYEFKYMNFETNSVDSLSVSSILKEVDTWNCNIYADSKLKSVLYSQVWKYIVTVVKYNEQRYRGIAINKFVNNCEKHLIECRGFYYRARNSAITNQIIGFKTS